MNTKTNINLKKTINSIIIFILFSSLTLSAKVKNDDKEIKLINIAAKQRMLSQRIAKDYLYMHKNIASNKTKKEVVEFHDNLIILGKNTNNTAMINKEINEVNKLWKIVHKFYNNIEKGGLPLIIFNTTNKITKKMDIVTTLYLGIKDKKK